MFGNDKLFLIYLTILLAAVSSVQAQDEGPYIEGEQFYFSLEDINANKITSTDEMFAGKVLFITLWGTWCAPCVTEIPTLNKLQSQYSDSGLVIIAIAFEYEEEDELRRSKLRRFIHKHNINYLVLDGGSPQNFETALPSVKNVKGLPVEIIINRRGKIETVRNGYGFSEVWVAKINQEIRTLLNKPASD